MSTFPVSSVIARYSTTAAHRFRSRLPAPATVARVAARLGAIERACTRWLIAYSIAILRVSVGAIFLAFGALKFFPGVSPAQNLVEATTAILTFGLVPGSVALVAVATLECVIGLLLISGRAPRAGVYLLGMQLIGILSPLVLLPGRLFAGPHGAPTLEGQYVLKDLIIVGAALVLAAAARGARLTSDQSRTKEHHDAARFRRPDHHHGGGDLSGAGSVSIRRHEDRRRQGQRLRPEEHHRQEGLDHEVGLAGQRPTQRHGDLGAGEVPFSDADEGQLLQEADKEGHLQAGLHDPRDEYVDEDQGALTGCHAGATP
jgi:uncharacterized membrane protein YphA (DoxX/SURF4 family)